MSPPTRGRGLKREQYMARQTYSGVAPHAGAWIETGPAAPSRPRLSMSPPTRGRGLKPARTASCDRRRRRSPPTRGRGLKRGETCFANSFPVVAPHAGAWIETVPRRHSTCTATVAPHAGAWIETHGGMDRSWPRHVAPHAGAWIETPLLEACSARWPSPPTRGRGLKRGGRRRPGPCVRRRPPRGGVD